MRRALFLLSLVAALVFACASAVLAQQQDRTAPTSSERGTPPKTPTEKIADQYIVVLNDDVSDPTEVGQRHANENALEVGFVYQNALKGYSARIPNAQALQRLR